ncbi:hypothetical protein [Spongiimicrobium sp. 3-5]|uniref:hypothetical protein n=1 Tax=Spongiimicrobium sp. 3-5 TaxID=3332596 RepID=UPI00398156FC
MVNNSLAVCFFFSILFFLPKFSQSQSINNDKDHYLWFDEAVGMENTGLVNGVVYDEKYRMINEKTKFFLSREFLPGSVTYDGQTYYDLELKFDVFDEDVLLKLPNRLGGITLKLIKDKVDAFVIDGHRFVKLNAKDSEEKTLSEFYEVMNNSSAFTLFKKHRKKDFNRKDQRKIYFEFVDIRGVFVLLYNNTYYSISKKKDVIEIFPEYKKEIDAFYERVRSLRNSDPDKFTLSLMNRIDILISGKNNQVTE